MELYLVTATDSKGFVVYNAWINAESKSEAIERSKPFIVNKYNKIEVFKLMSIKN